MSRNDPLDGLPDRSLLSPRDQALSDFTRYKHIINEFREGRMPTGVPWADPRFQDMLVSLISEIRQYKADADKLAVIRDVFGGNK